MNHAAAESTTHDARHGEISPEGLRVCKQILDDWIAAVNAHNATSMDSHLRFPHVRIAAGKVAVYDRSGSNPMDVFEKLAVEQGWHHSAWTDIRLIQSSPSKAHFAVQYTRYRGDGTVIGVFDSLYIFTCLEGVWKIQGRSSFGA